MGCRFATAAVALCLTLSAAAFAQPAPLAGLALEDHRQRPVAPAELAGRPVLMHFVFAGCSSVCPWQVQELRGLHDALPPDVRLRVVFLSVTVDPLGDDLEVLSAYARRHGVDRPGWRFVGGDAEQVFHLLDRVRVFASPGRPSADHRTSIFLYAPDGRLVQRFRGVPVDRPRLADELIRLARHPA